MDELTRTRASLINRLKDWRDDVGWQDFFQSYSHFIEGIARTAGLSDFEADEVLQETLVAVSRKMPEFQYDPVVGSFRAWLLKTTHWKICDQLRKRNGDLRRLQLSEDTETGMGIFDKIADPATPDLDALCDAEWGKSLLEVAFSKVKRKIPKDFQMYDLFVNKEWKAAKVAAAFNVDLNRVYRAKNRVSEALEKEVRRLKLEMD